MLVAFSSKESRLKSSATTFLMTLLQLARKYAERESERKDAQTDNEGSSEAGMKAHKIACSHILTLIRQFLASSHDVHDAKVC